MTDLLELLDELRWLKRVTEDDITNVYGRAIAAVEEALKARHTQAGDDSNV